MFFVLYQKNYPLLSFCWNASMPGAGETKRDSGNRVAFFYWSYQMAVNENKLRSISINFTHKTSHSFLK